jgi:NAD(P) transhydrogenase subunit alpha
VPTHASQLYSRNVQTLLDYIIKDGAIVLDMNDEIVRGTTLVNNGEIVHQPTLDALAVSGFGCGACVRRKRVSEALFTELTVFILAIFIGVEVISKVPTTLHTPLMSATNAIHGIVLVGAILVAGTFDAPFNAIVGVILVILASLNVFGGFTVTERMLEMFKPRPIVAKKDND